MVLLVMFASGLTATRIPLFAQTATGSILGTVTDPSGAAVGGRGSNDKIGCHGSTRRMATTEVGTYSGGSSSPR